MKKYIKDKHYNLHILENKNFKNYRLNIAFLNEYKREELSIRECLLRMIFMGNKLYNTSRDINIKCEELYDPIISTNQVRRGNIIFSNIYTLFLNPEYVDEKSYLEDNIKFIFDLIFKASFTQENLNFVKSSMIDEVESMDEDFRTYASFRAIEEMDENDFGAVSENGRIEDIKKITLEDLSDEYLRLLNESQIEISFLVKDYNDEIIDLIKKYAIFTNNKNKELKPYRNLIKTSKEFEEEKDYSQSALVCIYRLDDLTEREQSITAFLFNEILGGGGLDTRLNSSLRGNNSICYFCNSSYEKFDNKITITTLVSKENISKAKNLIIDVVNSMKKISDEEVEKNIKKIITVFDELNNSSYFLIVNQLLSDLGLSHTVDERIKLLKSVTTEELEKIVDKMNLNMVYVLKGVKENG